MYAGVFLFPFWIGCAHIPTRQFRGVHFRINFKTELVGTGKCQFWQGRNLFTAERFSFLLSFCPFSFFFSLGIHYSYTQEHRPNIRLPHNFSKRWLYLTNETIMAKTKSGSDVEKHIAQFANGRQMVYDGIKEYETIPKCDKKEYVSRLLGLYNAALQGAKQREQWVNEARQDATNCHQNAKEMSDELEAFKSSFWYKAYKLFK